jgi:galactokinase
MRAVARFFGQSDLRDVEHRALVARGPEIRAALGDRSLLRALHFSDENIRVPRMLDALKKGRIGSWLKLVRKSGDSSWKLLQNLQPSGRPGEQGLCIALALSADFLGNRGVARVHGGGFAGTIQAYVPRRLRKQYTFIMESYFGPASVIPLALRGRGAGRVSIPEGSNA